MCPLEAPFVVFPSLIQISDTITLQTVRRRQRIKPTGCFTAEIFHIRNLFCRWNPELLINQSKGRTFVFHSNNKSWLFYQVCSASQTHGDTQHERPKRPNAAAAAFLCLPSLEATPKWHRSDAHAPDVFVCARAHTALSSSERTTVTTTRAERDGAWRSGAERGGVRGDAGRQ